MTLKPVQNRTAHDQRRLTPFCWRWILAIGIFALPPAVLGAHLLLNGDAEIGNCSADVNAVTTVAGWRVT
jgi:hypothetical protein